MNKANILVVDDLEMNRMILENILMDKYNVYHAENGKQAIEIYEQTDLIIHLVLLDINMPVMNGYEVLEYMNEKGYLEETPVMVISTDVNEETILKAYDLGAVDYFNKPFSSNIVLKRVANILTVYGREYTDFLTGGANRKEFVREGEVFLKACKNTGDYALLYFDVQDFKAINELLGTIGGDHLLNQIYEAVNTMFPSLVLAARLEADHFVAIVPRNEIQYEEMLKRMDLSWNVDNKTIHVFLKCGIAYIDDKPLSIDNYIDRARLARQLIIDEYVHPFKVFDETMRHSYIDKAEVITSFIHGLENGEFLVYYQPVFNPETNKIVSAEALVRWKNAEKGLISPAVFIPALESGGYISKLDNYIIEHVSEVMSKRRLDGLPVVPVSVNLSWMDFYDKNVETTIRTVLQQPDAKEIIRFEVTETSFAALENNNASMTLGLIRSFGSKILLDDFGTGYSSLSMIDKFEFDILKIDMGFVRKIGINKRIEIIIQLIIDMCHKIGIKVIAEGAENKEQIQFLQENGCDFIQGYYYSKPLPEEEFFDFIKKHL